MRRNRNAELMLISDDISKLNFGPIEKGIRERIERTNDVHLLNKLASWTVHLSSIIFLMEQQIESEKVDYFLREDEFSAGLLEYIETRGYIYDSWGRNTKGQICITLLNTLKKQQEVVKNYFE